MLHRPISVLRSALHGFSLPSVCSISHHATGLPLYREDRSFQDRLVLKTSQAEVSKKPNPGVLFRLDEIPLIYCKTVLLRSVLENPFQYRGDLLAAQRQGRFLRLIQL